jgi:hypothetical protein
VACNTFNKSYINREEPPGSGSGWTTDDLDFLPYGDTLDIRGWFTVIPGGGVDCTADIDYQYRLNGQAWVTWESVKFGTKDTTYDKTFNPSYLGIGVGMVDLRLRTTYDGFTYPSIPTTITITEIAEWQEGSGTDATYEEKESVAAAWAEKEGTAAAYEEKEAVAATWAEKEGTAAAWAEKEGTAATWSETESTAATWEEFEKVDATWTEKESVAAAYEEKEGVAATWEEKSGSSDTWTEGSPP